MKRIYDLLQNQGENYILPFFWQHGETEAKLREYMNAIHDCGIGAVCVECRPHPDFCGPKWWEDMDVILDEAKKLDMKVWILDDAHFPTGQANGAVETAPAELCKQFLNYNVMELSGPMPSVGVNVAAQAKFRKNPFAGAGGMGLFGRAKPARDFDDDELVAVVAAEGLDTGIDAATLVDLTDKVVDGQLDWDVPAGMWRLFILYKTRNGGGSPHYINVTSMPSCKLQLDAVYEPHWEHYKDEFGKTILGFFSDEPGFGNFSGGMDNRIGKKTPLPWSDEVESALKERWGADYGKLLSTLWFPDKAGAVSAYARYHYMDIVTRLVEKDFSFQIGDWCEKHGVKYIGHTIEDNNQHARLAQSFGHQFRGLAGQHMGGIDDIGGQVLFGGDKLMRSGMLGPSQGGDPAVDGEFFHHLLGKLGSSHGHLDPRKSGDSMCEIFGAYGWSEGTRLMKYLTDHFLVRGINHYVPHAFSPKEFPDFDCPPHFYAHGFNPLYKGFGQLMRYMNRVCHLISGGTPKPAVGVLYHAEAEWTSREEGYMLSQKPMKALAQAQIDAEVVWTDLLTERERHGTVLGKTLTVNGVEMKALVIPYSYYITSELANFVAEAAEVGFPVIFVGGKPSGIADKPCMAMPAAVEAAPVVALEELGAAMAAYADVVLDAPYAELHYLRYGHESDLYMISNESTDKTFFGRVKLAGEGTPVLYDAMANVLRPADWDGEAVTLTLPPYQSIIVAFGVEGETVAAVQPEGEKCVIDGPWKLSYKAALDQAAGWQNETTLDALTNLAKVAPTFSGWLRYETSFTAPAAAQAVLCFENAFETVEVTVNGKSAGMAICPPYQFDLSGLLVEGENTLVVEVATTLERAVANLPMDPNNPYAGMMKMFAGGGASYPFGLIGEAAVWVK